MSTPTTGPTWTGAAITVALLLPIFGYNAARTPVIAEPVIAKSAAEARRWFDDHMGRTTLLAFFDRSKGEDCFNLAGLLALREERIELTYPAILGRGIRHGPSDARPLAFRSSFHFQDDRCRIRVSQRQEVLDGGRWIAVGLWKPPELKRPSPDGKNGRKQELPPLGEWRIVPNEPGSGAQLTLQRKGFDAWNGTAMQAVIFSKTAQKPCPRGTALFSVMPAGISIVFRDTRAELPFTVEESVDRQNQNVSFVFSSPTCRLTMKIEKEVLHDGVWARLNPEPERD